MQQEAVPAPESYEVGATRCAESGAGYGVGDGQLAEDRHRQISNAGGGESAQSERNLFTAFLRDQSRCTDVFQEIDNWSALTVDIDEVFASGNVDLMASRLAALQQSLKLIGKKVIAVG